MVSNASAMDSTKRRNPTLISHTVNLVAQEDQLRRGVLVRDFHGLELGRGGCELLLNALGISHRDKYRKAHCANMLWTTRVLEGKLLRWGVTFSDTLYTISKNNTETKTPRFMCDHTIAFCGWARMDRMCAFLDTQNKTNVVYDYI
jgi:hypothetical protein